MSSYHAITALPLDEVLKAARDTQRLELGRDNLEQFAQLFREVCPGQSAAIVTDRSVWNIAAKRIQEALVHAGIPTVEPFIFDDTDLYAEYRFVEACETSLRQHDAIPVAVGSGTLNDIAKLAAHLVGRPSLCVATAASMDGYTAYGSSITYLGSKQTFDCPAPRAVLADLAIIGNAPSGMNAWGYADLSAKITAGADWIFADALGVEPIDSRSWSTVQAGLRQALSDPQGVKAGHPDAIHDLVEGLMLGGFAMQSSLSSRPASGAEHQFSHLWDMQHHTHLGEAPSHGTKVGIGTLAITAFYEAMFELQLEELDVEAAVAAWPSTEAWLDAAKARFDEAELQAVALREIQAKSCDADTLRAQLTTLKTQWASLREHLKSQLLPFDVLKARLEAVGAATEPESIGISRERLRETFLSAFFIRRRFTVLDVAVRSGTLETCLNTVFGPQGRWPIAS